jgi:type IV secretory pathway TrbD component
MNKNLGNSDRIFRLAGGLTLVIIGLVAQSWWGLIGIPLIATALIGFCPAYAPFGISTRKFDHK